MTTPVHHITTTEECQAFIADWVREAEYVGYVQPAAYAVGVAHYSSNGNMLDTWFPLVNFKGENPGVGVLLANETNYLHGVLSTELSAEEISNILWALKAYEEDGQPHPNIEVLKMLLPIAEDEANERTRVVVSFIGDHETMPPEGVSDAYLRLHLLSHRKVQPHGVNLGDLYNVLPSVVWTNQGPVAQEDLVAAQMKALCVGSYLQITSRDKFPPMLQYVQPSGVRVADGARVRLGAYLAEGTTVMHEGFVNFNAGTLGPCMVEGRISAGVVVGAGTDIGGGASIMGTLSGGNDIRVSIGENCLLEAESGLGIPVGDRVRVAVGDYIKGSTLVRINRFGWDDNPVALEAIRRKGGGKGTSYWTIKASELTGISDAIFRRNDRDGVIEVIPRGTSTWGALTEALHNN